jgi:anti-anti-sigma factor
MDNVVRQSGVTILRAGPDYESLDDPVMRKFGEALMREAGEADPPRLVVDLGEMEYVGSAFLELLVRAWKRLKPRGGLMALCEAQPFCIEVLESTRLDSLWPAYPSRDEAVAALKPPTDGEKEAGAEKQPG